MQFIYCSPVDFDSTRDRFTTDRSQLLKLPKVIFSPPRDRLEKNRRERPGRKTNARRWLDVKTRLRRAQGGWKERRSETYVVVEGRSVIGGPRKIFVPLCTRFRRCFSPAAALRVSSTFRRTHIDCKHSASTLFEPPPSRALCAETLARNYWNAVLRFRYPRPRGKLSFLRAGLD